MKKTDTQIQRDGRGMLNRLLSYLKPFRGELAFGIFVLAMLAALDTIFPIMLREGIDRFAESFFYNGLYDCYSDERFPYSRLWLCGLCLGRFHRIRSCHAAVLLCRAKEISDKL